ncbi:Y-family DNA polymerase [Glaciimonas immobilis]|uniref:Protein ImuB n=1 Tax=Glaciimonas immobilis TaxID=728004 RepID=A0A840RP51_9BURK|nr:DNA polymerase Y family protein [Glaciimonas immobilis]KAF3999255.1 DNA polymerase Y family protein [Glaciimonas immobilis]MBB5198718.1 protein ImuB [Glaciimonas immobilis]
MPLWIGVHLSLLPLESLRPRWSAPGLLAVMDHEQVLTMTAEAAASGIRHGMRRGGVMAIAPLTALCERSLLKEQSALDAIALTLLQYTPEVTHAEEASLLINISASLSAFGGRLMLCHRVRASIDALGFTAHISMGPTAQGAWFLARYLAHSPLRKQRRCVRIETQIRYIEALPFSILPAARPYQEWLEGIGCRTLGDLRKLPRAGLQRRSDKRILEALDCAAGIAPEMFEWVQAPKEFSAYLELPDRIEHAEAVLYGTRRLIQQLIGWLAAQQLAISGFVLSMVHERGRQAIDPSTLEITLAEPAWHEEHLLRLLKERLNRFQLSAPIIALRLNVTHVTAMLPPTASLFPEPGGTTADYHRLLELLNARLGAENVLMPAAFADHRPEIANSWQAASNQMTNKPAQSTQERLSPRPFWLLQQPLALLVRDHRPFYGSPLRLLSGPERIEAGWWDEGLAVRDYFIAEGSEAARYWVYRERAGEEISWFLHGLFA